MGSQSHLSCLVMTGLGRGRDMQKIIKEYIREILDKEAVEVNKRIGIVVDKEWINYRDKQNSITDKLANRVLNGDLDFDWDEEYKRLWGEWV